MPMRIAASAPVFRAFAAKKLILILFLIIILPAKRG
jgi:hypothetical protein